MGEGATQPAGFCPYCGYRIDPGVCPECGRAINARRLARSRLPSRIRNVNRGAVLGAIVLCTVSFWAVGYFVGWLSMLPTEVLLLLQGDGTSDTTKELHKRCLAGDLSEGQIRRMIEHNLTLVATVRNPVPEGVAAEVDFTWSGALPAGLLLRSNSWEMYVDDKWRSSKSGGPMLVNGTGDQTWLSPLTKPGRHTVQIEQFFLLSQLTMPASPLIPPMSFTHSGDVMIDVVKWPLSGFKRVPLSPLTVDEMAKQFLLHIRFHPELNSYVIRLRSDPLPRNMQWVLSTIPTEDSELESLLHLETRKDEAFDKTSTRKADEKFPRRKRLDLRLRSGLYEDFNNGLDSCVDMSVEWRDLEVHVVTPEELAKGEIEENFVPASEVIQRVD